MLVLIHCFKWSIISLRNGGLLGETSDLLLSIKSKIEALKCNINSPKKQLFLLNQDIRDISDNKILVNDYDALSEASDLIRLKRLNWFKFMIVGKPVVTKVSKN